MNIISLDKVSLGYKNTVVIKNLSLDIKERDFICIVGSNGSGKTTLLRGILGLLPLMSGKIKFDIDRNQIGYIPQETSVDPHFPATVSEIAISGALNNRCNFYNRAIKKRLADVLKTLGIKNLSTRSFSDLSGGQRQKVLLARALMATKSLLILDEPSNNLDQKSKKELYQLLRKLNSEQEIAIIMVTHDLDHGNLIGDKILALQDYGYFYGTTEAYVKEIHHE